MPNRDNPNDDVTKLRRELMIEKIRRDPFQSFRDNLFVPIGCLVTFGALALGLWGFQKGKRKLSQHMMQVRIIAQGVTMTALIASFFSRAKTTK